MTACVLYYCRYFNNPQPPLRAVLDAVSNFRTGIRKSLIAGTIRQRTIKVNFQITTFKFLFKGKGKKVPHRPGCMYYLHDFDQHYFTPDDFVFYNKDDEGCKVDFPIITCTCT